MATNKKVNLLEVLAEKAEREANSKAERDAILQIVLEENARYKAERQAEREAKAIKSETVYVSNEELGEPAYPSRRISPNAKIIRERLSGMKVGNFAHFPEFAFPEGDGRGSDKEVTKTKKLFHNEFTRISKEFGFKVQVRFSRSKGNTLTPSVTVTGKRGS